MEETMIEVIRGIRSNSEDIKILSDMIIAKANFIEQSEGPYEEVKATVDELIEDMFLVRDELTKNFTNLRRKMKE